MKAPWLWRAVTELLPARFRLRHRQEMELLLAEQLEGERWTRRALVWTRACVDALAFAYAARRAGRDDGAWGGGGMDGWIRDVRHAVRGLRSRPAFSGMAIATLALGMGAATLVFSVVNGVLLRPLPYEGADRIGLIWHQFGGGEQDLPSLSPLDLYDYRARSRVFDAFTLASGREWIVGGQDDPELIDVGQVEAGFFEFFGVTMEHGRSFLPSEDARGAASVAVLSHRLWERRFGGDPSIVGRAIDVAGTTMQVVGVAPASFRLHLPAEAFLLRDAELWTPLRLDPARQPPRNYTGYTGFARLRPGATFAQGQQEIETMAARLVAEHPEHAASNLEPRVVPLHHDVVKSAESALLLLMGAVGFLLLIACANVANLVVIRGRGRGRELAIRAAIGAGRAGLVRLALMESAVLSLAGSTAGVFVAYGGLSALRVMDLGGVPLLESVTIDGRVLAFTAGMAFVSAALVGLVPALRGSLEQPASVLRDGGRSGARGQRGFRDGLIVIEVAASLILLVASGLMVRTFLALGAVDPGYDTRGGVTFRLSLPASSLSDVEERVAFLDELLGSLEGLPGVTAAAAIDQLPLTGSGALQPFAYDEETARNWESVSADRRWVSLGLFDAIGATLRAGRRFEEADIDVGSNVIVDDRLAERAFPGGDAVGRLLQVNGNDQPESIRYARIVGVVEHLRLHDLSGPSLPQIYFPIRGLPRFSVVVRSDGDADRLVPAIRAEVRRLAPGAPVEDVRTLEQLAGESLAAVRLTLGLMTAFGCTALLLACVGLYGVLSYAVAQRTREIGVRMALGQKPSEVRRLVLAEGGRLVALAILLGIGGAVALGRLLSGLLYEVQPMDPLTLLVTSSVLASVALLACWTPARRATRVDPVTALRD